MSKHESYFKKLSPKTDLKEIKVNQNSFLRNLDTILAPNFKIFCHACLKKKIFLKLH